MARSAPGSLAGCGRSRPQGPLCGAGSARGREHRRLRRARTLVKLLALTPGHRLHREQVMDLLWPGRDPVSAANSLHQVLYAARRALSSTGAAGDTLLALRGEMVVLPGDGSLDVDVEAFAVAAARAMETRAGEDVRAALGPGLIVRCAGAAYVLRGVEFANSQGIGLAVRGGGHSVPGFSPVTEGRCSTCPR